MSPQCEGSEEIETVLGVVLFVALYGSLIFVVLLVPYWLIRLAVRHGIEDAWERRSDRKL